ncbi:unnamed protein product [marine sediment metagenome]|uniref:Uncharacterized protein n=1 Tax=marine sediment metagenome TaxID=412755 RepID=X1FPT3_9ZZZZ
MTLEKAIVILTDATHFHFPADGLDFRDALNLGIEALQEKLRNGNGGTP